MNLYVHFPFCVRKCLYCDFNSVAGSPVTAEQYASAVVREMELRAPGTDSQRAGTLYFGGGTPSLWGAASVGRVIDAAARLHGLAADAEITLEANPGTVTREQLRGYREVGVNRLSLGVQSFDDAFLTRLGRLHTSRQATEAYEAARSVGFQNIGIDLMHSLPEQSSAQWLDELAAAVRLAPDHVSAYGLTVEEGTPFHRLRERGELPIPGEDTALKMFRDTRSYLTGCGYEQYEISNFARPGRRSAHNQVYWRRGDYAGFGAGAHSFSSAPEYGSRWHNENDLSLYMADIEKGVLPQRELTVLERGDAMAEFMFLGLRMLEGVVEEAFHSQFGASIDEVYGAEVRTLECSGMILREKGRLRVSERGILLHNQVVLKFL